MAVPVVVIVAVHRVAVVPGAVQAVATVEVVPGAVLKAVVLEAVRVVLPAEE